MSVGRVVMAVVVVGVVVGVVGVVVSCRRWVPITAVGVSHEADEACRSGDVEACGVLAEALGRWGRHTRAVALARDACDAGSAVGCAALARALGTGDGLERDPAASLSLYRRACDEGVAFACVNAGVRLLEPEHRNLEAAARASLMACDAGDLLGCANYGYQLYDVEARDFERAMGFFVSTCDAGLAAGCRRAARGYLEGRLPSTDVDAGLGLALAACEADDGRGCVHGAGVLLDAGQPVAALRLLRRGCVRGGWGCSELAERTLAMASTEVDVWDARWAGEAACSESPEGCVALARALRLQPKPDEARATSLLWFACDGGVARACALADGGLP